MGWFGRLRAAASGWAGAGLDVILPPRCAVCGDELPPAAARADVAPACTACVAALTGAGERCAACGAPAAAGGCSVCRGRGRRWREIVVLGAYADELRSAVLRAKRPAGAAVAATLATLLVRRHGRVMADWRLDAIVPVPMHWLRRAGRGASAADEIARGVARGLGLPCRRLLRRGRATVMQNTLPVGDRRDNVRGAFRARGRLAGLRILLVDDVTTTGSTLEACAEAAVSAGAAAVYAAAVARADGDASGDA